MPAAPRRAPRGRLAARERRDERGRPPPRSRARSIAATSASISTMPAASSAVSQSATIEAARRIACSSRSGAPARRRRASRSARRPPRPVPRRAQRKTTPPCPRGSHGSTAAISSSSSTRASAASAAPARSACPASARAYPARHMADPSRTPIGTSHASCSRRSGATTTASPPCSRSARIRAGAARSSPAVPCRRPRTCSTSRPARPRSRSRWPALRLPRHRSRPVRRHARDGRAPRGAAGLAGRIELVEGNAEALPFDDASFDGVTSTYFLRYVDDVPAAIRELARVARPGAPVGYLDFGVPPLPRPASPGRATRAPACRSPGARSATAGSRSAASSTARSRASASATRRRA